MSKMKRFHEMAARLAQKSKNKKSCEGTRFMRQKSWKRTTFLEIEPLRCNNPALSAVYSAERQNRYIRNADKKRPLFGHEIQEEHSDEDDA